MARVATSRYVPRTREPLPASRPARPPGPQRPPLSHFVLLSMLLHILGISLFGAPSGGSKEGRAMWGSLQVVLQRAPPEPAPELKIERGLNLDAPKRAPREGVAPRREAPPAPLKPDERIAVPAPPVVPPPQPAKPAPAEPAPIVVPPMIDRLPTPERRTDPPPPRVPLPTPPQATPAPLPLPEAPPVIATPEPAPASEAAAPPPVPAPARVERAPSEAPPIAAPIIEPVPVPPPIERAPAAPQPLPAPLAAPPVERAPVERPPAEPAPVERPPAEPAPVEARPVPALPAEVLPPARVEPAVPAPRAPEVSRPPEATPAEPARAEPRPPAAPAPLKAPDVEPPALRPSPFRAPDAPRRDSLDPNYDPTAGPPQLDAEALRRRAGQMAREGTGNRAVLPFPMPPQPERKTKEQIAIEKARKPDCRDAYKELGLAAVVPLLANQFGEGTCRW